MSLLSEQVSESPLLQQSFREQGYVVIDSAFLTEDLLAFKNILKKAVNIQLIKASKEYPHLESFIKSFDIDTGLQALRSVNPLYVSMIQLTVSRTPEFFRLTSSPKMIQAVRAVLELSEDGVVYEISNGVIFTMPKDEANKHDSNVNLDWHKDTFYTIPRSRFVQIWAPLINNATASIGALKICPGSHKEVIGKQRYNFEANFNHRYTMEPSEVAKYVPRSIEINVGQLLIFDGRLIHGSGTNSSNRVRCTLLGLFHDVSSESFIPPAIEYKYLTETPEAYFYEVFGDERIKSIINEQAMNPTHFD